MKHRPLYYLIGIFGIGMFLLWIFVIPGSNYGQRAQVNDFDLAGGPEREGRGFPQREIIDLASEYPDVFFRFGSNEKKLIALTFDDGPDDLFTPQILDVLKEHEVPATFFVVGRRCELFPEVLKRMASEGHIIGNHTWSHPNIIKLSNDKVIEELKQTDEIINRLAGYIPILFRSPYGSMDREKVELVAKRGYKHIAWSVDSLDWKGLSAEEVKTNILENVIEGSIILQHSAGGVGEDLSGTIKALSDIIKVLKKDGYEFTTIDKLLGLPYKK
ncbi:polysaccharide deacetylase family protein [Desulfitibacter alkalitolerans]|uniref:polysaccharide deacetylase family protein n=1 Tax=Desulfitibacter alkalitolerans TaxID=264641 RepID=UPI000A002F18|nr:polysaccharide deacetylase family protein [Desulfitibacter alkalitolerans]